MTCKEKEVLQALSFNQDSDNSLSVLITTMVANEKGVDITELTPLKNAVDINGVQAGINAVQDNPDGSARISFSFEGYLVTVSSDETIELSELP